MKYFVLGSSASLPTHERNGPGGLLMCDSERAIIDCAEGTTRQLSILGQSLQKISLVWISHSHLDHYVGLANFLRCLDLLASQRPLSIFGGEETIKGVEILLHLSRLKSISVELHVIQEGIFYENDRLMWRSFPLEHTVPTLGLVVEEKPSRAFIPQHAQELGIPEGSVRSELASGKTVVLPDGRRIKPDQVLGPSIQGRKFVYVSDTEMFEGLKEFCRDADLLICESTYTSVDSELSKKYKHMTAKEAACLARDAGAKRLLLTHISPRENSLELENEAKSIFKAVNVAEDLAFYDVPARNS